MNISDSQLAQIYKPAINPNRVVESFKISFVVEYDEFVEATDQYDDTRVGVWYWGVYAVCKDGTSEHICDRKTRKDAFEVYERMLNTELPIEIMGPEVDPLESKGVFDVNV
ncbi:hypothetical protein [Vibrio owensii]|uniref:hypothetical protein n=1 Tax=Vibrio owensii TaxID=696485 RepID=UPI0018F10E7C|nr:hypothetical protein [Vibrio owensii]